MGGFLGGVRVPAWCPVGDFARDAVAESVVTPARWLTSIALLGLTFLYLQFFTTGERVPLRKPLAGFPIVIDEWRSAETETFDDETMAILKPSDYLLRRYVDTQGRSAWLYVGYWETQRKGAQVHSPKNCLPGGGWEPMEVSQIRIPIPAVDQSIEANRYLLKKDHDGMLVLYWFQSQHRAVAGELEAKIEMVKNAILHNRSDAAIVRVSSPTYDNIAATNDWLVKFTQSVYPRLEEFLPE
jgi:EpsI family protein